MMDGDAAVARPLFRQKSGPLAVGWLAGETLGTFFVLANPFPLFPSLSGALLWAAQRCFCGASAPGREAWLAGPAVSYSCRHSSPVGQYSSAAL